MTTKYRDHTPLNRVILVQLKADKVSEGGIIMAASFDKRQQYATEEAYLLKKGAGAFKSADWIGREPEVGELMVIAKYAGGTEYTDVVENEVCKLISDADVHSIIEGEGLNDQ